MSQNVLFLAGPETNWGILWGHSFGCRTQFRALRVATFLALHSFGCHTQLRYFRFLRKLQVGVMDVLILKQAVLILALAMLTCLLYSAASLHVIDFVFTLCLEEERFCGS